MSKRKFYVGLSTGFAVGATLFTIFLWSLFVYKWCGGSFSGRLLIAGIVWIVLSGVWWGVRGLWKNWPLDTW